MKRILAGTLIATVAASAAWAQGPTLSEAIEVFVFPRAGQAADQQSKDEAECFDFASDRVGTDPFALSRDAQAAEARAREEQERAAEAARGSAVRGAARGAATGALIGAIGGDMRAGRTAGMGAAAGAVTSRGAASQQSRQAQQDAAARNEATQAQIDAQKTDFRNAFAVCLEAKDYVVRF